MGPVLSIVAPAYNEERNIPAFLGAIIPVLEGIGETFEIIFVNDGSRDGTLGMLAAAASQDPRIKVLGLARNFGKDIALSAGLSHASGQAVIPIDCDLQHPVELIPAFVAKWREGYDMVIGVRSRRDEEGYVRRTLSRTYYRVMKYMTSVEIPPNAGDFRLLDRKILDVINKMPERHRFMKGIFAWPGFKVASIEFQANIRANETASRWSFFKLWRFALDGLFSFSTAPLKLWTYIGALSAGGAFLYLLITIIQKLFWGIQVPGYASLLIVVLFFNGLLLISNGIQGEYIARIFEEVKGRPLYVIGETFGFPDSVASRSGVVARPMMGLATAPHVAPPPPQSDTNATQIGIPSAPVTANAPLASAASPPSSPHSIPETRPLRPAKISQPPPAGALGPSAFANIGAATGSSAPSAPAAPAAASASSAPSSRLTSAPIIGSASPSSARRPHSPSQAGTPRPHSPSQQPLPFSGDAASQHAQPFAPSHPAAAHAQPTPSQPAAQAATHAQPFAPSHPAAAHAQPTPSQPAPQAATHAQPFAPSSPSQPAAAQPPATVIPKRAVSDAWDESGTPHRPSQRAPSAPPVAASTRAPSSPPVAVSTRAPSSPPIAPQRAPSSPPVATEAPSDAAAAGATPPPTPTRPKRELPKPTKGPIVPR